jgi:hypothetical protein
VFTGKDDRLLRRLVVAADVADAKSAATVSLDLTYTGVNEDKEISAPEGARPFSELLAQLSALKGLGLGLGGGAGAGGGSAKDLQRYSRCVRRAGASAAAARRCAERLAP